MPGFNQTGPVGQGPMTGRRMGRCTNFGANLKVQPNPANENSEQRLTDDNSGRGLGLGRGRGAQGGFGRRLGRQNRFRGGN